jgi:hypothetical protein
MNRSGDSIRVVHPLFPEEGGGSIPTSPLQLEIGQMPVKAACLLNNQWHSRLPELTNWQACFAYGAICGGLYYAVAIWGQPVAREYNGRGYLELRRMAVHDEAPQNTASRMLRVMRVLIKRAFPNTVRLISYQDTAVHKGTIYKAAGWRVGGMKKNIGTGWLTRNRPQMQSAADKVRWEYDLNCSTR